MGHDHFQQKHDFEININCRTLTKAKIDYQNATSRFQGKNKLWSAKSKADAPFLLQIQGDDEMIDGIWSSHFTLPKTNIANRPWK